MPPRDAAGNLEAALARGERLLARTRAQRAALNSADDPTEVRALARTLEPIEDQLNDLDNNLGEAVEAWAESEAGELLKEAGRLLRPLFARAAALEHAGADGERLRELLGLADALEVKPERDPESDVSRLAERVCAVRSGIDRALGLGEILEARSARDWRRGAP